MKLKSFLISRWQWIISFPITLLAILIHSTMNISPETNSFTFSYFFELALILWWGPRVLPGIIMASLFSTSLFEEQTWYSFCTLGIPQFFILFLTWFLIIKWQSLNINLIDNKSFVRFIIYAATVPIIILSSSQLLLIKLFQTIFLTETPPYLPITNTVDYIIGILVITVPLLMILSFPLYSRDLLNRAVKIYPKQLFTFTKSSYHEYFQTFVITFLLFILHFLFPLSSHWYLLGLAVILSSIWLKLEQVVLLNLAAIFLNFFHPTFIQFTINQHEHLEFSQDIKIILSTLYISSLIISTALNNLKDEVLAHKQTEDRLQDASLAKSEFLARISHEIRTPLNAILGMLDLLKSTKLSGEQLRYIQSFSHAGENLQALINDILDISKIESRQVKIESIAFSFRETIGNVFHVLEQRAESKGLLFTFQIEESIPDFILSDPTRIRQILLNLLSNSLKFTEKGFVKLEITEKNNPDGISVLHFEISDSGIGIPKDKRSVLFQSFTQADSSIHRRFGGTGLGLAICKNLVELMGGRIWLSPEDNIGSIFIFEIPYRLAPIKKMSISGSKAEKSDLFLANKIFKILIVDDSEDNLLLLKHFLKNKPIELFEARNGQEAIDIYSENNLDFILMDIQMPVLDGHAATMKIRQIEKDFNRKYIPILALSASALSEEISRSLAVGCNEHLVKPLNKSILEETLIRYLI